MELEKRLSEVVCYKPNQVTISRLFILFMAIAVYPISVEFTLVLVMLDVALDWVDGKVARAYKQCTFFGETIDWITDYSTQVTILTWWIGLEPSLNWLLSSILLFDLTLMIYDILYKALGFELKPRTNGLVLWVLKYTFDVEKGGYSPKSVGYYSDIAYYLCGISRVAYLRTGNEMWWWVFAFCVPFSIIYLWMHFAYLLNIMSCWREVTKKGQQLVKFKATK